MARRRVDLSAALRIAKRDVTAFVGAGGKTSAMFACAKLTAPSIITTSTHIFNEQKKLADLVFILEPDQDPTVLFQNIEPDQVVLFTGVLNQDTDRLSAPTTWQLERIRCLAEQLGVPLFIEADGARQRTIKAPAEHEPAIPPFCTKVVVVAGLSAIDQPLNEATTHRPEIFGQLAGIAPEQEVTPTAFAQAICHPQGGLKNIPPTASKHLLLTQAVDDKSKAVGSEIADLCRESFDSVVTCELHPFPPQIYSVNEHIAGVVLAAGRASRMKGLCKPLLPLDGVSFIKRIVQSAHKAGLSPVVVVTGEADAVIRAELAQEDVVVIHNHRWMEGQSGSVQAGLAAVPHKVGAAIFLLADQPQVTVELLKTLIEKHQHTFARIVAPLIGGKRANPVLFDRVTFGEFHTLQGDVGARQIMPKFEVEYFDWLDELMGLDVDSPEDYELLQKLYEEDRNV